MTTGMADVKSLIHLTISALRSSLCAATTSHRNVGPWRAAATGLLCAAVGITGCSSGGGGDNGPPPTVIIATPQTVVKGESRQLSATVVDAAPGVTWTVEGGSVYGTITPGGLYTAPSTVPEGPVVVRATSTDDPRGTATATVRVVVGQEVNRQLNQAISPNGAKANTFSGGQRSVAIHGSVVYLVWNDDRSGHDDVYFAVSLDRGVTFGPSVRVNEDAALGGTRPQMFPSVAVDGSGRAVIAWLDGRLYSDLDPRFDVYVATATVASNGAIQVGANQRVTTAGTPDTSDPSVALAVDPTGNAYLAWADGSSGGSTDVLLTKASRLPSGLFQTTPPVLVNQYVLLDQGRPSVAVSETGDLVVAWHSRQEVANQIEIDWEVFWRRGRFDALGAMTWTTDETRVNLQTLGDQVSPSVAIVSDGDAQLPDGTAVIAWSQQIGLERRKLYFAKSASADDLTVDSNVDVMQSIDSDQNFPSVAVVGTEITIGVADNRRCSSCTSDPLDPTGTGVTDIYVVRSVDGGQTFPQPDLPLNDDDQSLKLHGRPSVAVDETGRVYALWTDDRNNVSQAFMGRAE